MRRSLCVLLVWAAIAVGAPASATIPDGSPCVSRYTMEFSAPMSIPGDPTTVSFTMTRDSGTGLCADGPVPLDGLSGSLTGYCAAATGWGILPNGHTVDIVWAHASFSMFSDEAAGQLLIGGACGGTTWSGWGALGSVPQFDDACVGLGTLSLGAPFTENGTTTTTFAFHLTSSGGCTNLSSVFHAVGTVTGGCSAATGEGVTSDGHHFDLEWLKNRLILSRNVVAVITATPDPFSGSNCTTGATNFLVSGGAAKLH